MGSVAIDIVNAKDFVDFLNGMQLTNFLQIRSAREFACDDVSSLYARVDLCRRSLAAPSHAHLYYLLIARRAQDVSMISKDTLPCLFETVTVDHGMMIRGSKNGGHNLDTGSVNLRMEIVLQQTICFGASYIDALVCRFQSGPRK